MERVLQEHVRVVREIALHALHPTERKLRSSESLRVGVAVGVVRETFNSHRSGSNASVTENIRGMAYPM